MKGRCGSPAGGLQYGSSFWRGRRAARLRRGRRGALRHAGCGMTLRQGTPLQAAVWPRKRACSADGWEAVRPLPLQLFLGMERQQKEPGAVLQHGACWVGAALQPAGARRSKGCLRRTLSALQPCAWMGSRQALASASPATLRQLCSRRHTFKAACPRKLQLSAGSLPSAVS